MSKAEIALLGLSLYVLFIACLLKPNGNVLSVILLKAGPMVAALACIGLLVIEGRS